MRIDKFNSYSYFAVTFSYDYVEPTQILEVSNFSVFVVHLSCFFLVLGGQ